MLALAEEHPGNSYVATAPPLDEVAWLSAVALDRDRHAFQQIYMHFMPRIKQFMVRQGADEHSADDLAQETMVQVWRKAAQYDPDKSPPSAWIYRIARNLRIDRLRKQKVHEVEFSEEAGPEESESHDENADPGVLMDADKLQAMITQLPGEQYQIIRLAYFEGLSQREIGEHLSIPLGTVKSRMRLAFAKLREVIGEF